MLILNGEAVAASLSMQDCITALRAALMDFARGLYRQPPRVQLRADSGAALMGLMPVFRGGPQSLWAVKDILVSSSNPARGLASHQGAILLHDGVTGELMAIVDATAITELRTAAVSAIATQALARPDAGQVAVIGTGRQALAHIEALKIVLPSARFAIWGRSAERARSLAAATGAIAHESARSAVAGADVICTVTSAATPVIERAWLAPGCHINAVGTSAPTAREIGSDIVAAAEFFVDTRIQASTECGEILLAIDEGAIGPDHIRGEIGEVLTGACAGRSSAEAITLFKSLGMAVEDMAAALCAVDHAKARQLGREIDWR